MTLLLALFHKTFCVANLSDLLGDIVPIFLKKDVIGIADTQCRKVSLRHEF